MGGSLVSLRAQTITNINIESGVWSHLIVALERRPDRTVYMANSSINETMNMVESVFKFLANGPPVGTGY